MPPNRHKKWDNQGVYKLIGGRSKGKTLWNLRHPSHPYTFGIALSRRLLFIDHSRGKDPIQRARFCRHYVATKNWLSNLMHQRDHNARSTTLTSVIGDSVFVGTNERQSFMYATRHDYLLAQTTNRRQLSFCSLIRGWIFRLRRVVLAQRITEQQRNTRIT